ncbi:MAG: hypothetical protein GPOALKHO_000053 [Sodalis sp.]|uniref:hypothetical protein n=1 Tax=Sodalis sp. (in: enterobacteria) TaxID=1898979 RepID=UPI003872C877|nr:MAG: hypothetical protein GPOALKHO_000053 [Sodalis sp.]
MTIELISDIHKNGQNENKVPEISLKIWKNLATALIVVSDIGNENRRRETAFSIINGVSTQEFYNIMILMLIMMLGRV